MPTNHSVPTASSLSQPEPDPPDSGFCPHTIAPIPVVCLAGPTGAGKTAASFALCEAFAGVVINMDSRQVYRDFPLVTAQPSHDEQTRFPHYLYGFLPTEQALGAGEYIRQCAPVIESVHMAGKLPILVGGTGLYMNALLHGVAIIPPVPETIRANLQERYIKEGGQVLYAALQKVDPDYAAKIHPNDRQRVTRALEVHTATGKPLSWWHAQPLPPSPYRAVNLGIQRTIGELEPLLEKRIDLMLAAGALEEVRQAKEICDKAAAPGWSGIGCAELYCYLEGALTFNECRNLWLKNTRAYAKRQLTWFNADKSITWFAPHEIDSMICHVRRKLADHQ